MNNNTIANILLTIGIISTVIGNILMVIGFYKDNMDEYLEYLKVNDFGEYLHLKAVFDDIHSIDDSILPYIGLSMIVGGLVICIPISTVYRD